MGGVPGLGRLVLAVQLDGARDHPALLARQIRDGKCLLHQRLPLAGGRGRGGVLIEGRGMGGVGLGWRWEDVSLLINACACTPRLTILEG